MTSPRERIAARSMTFSSSRTLPGQAYVSSFATASAESDVAARALRCAYFRKKCSERTRTSPFRSRSGGRRIGKTATRDASSGKVPTSGQATSRLGVSETTTRTSTAVDSVAPTRSTTPSARNRTRRAASDGVIGAGSSR